MSDLNGNESAARDKKGVRATVIKYLIITLGCVLYSLGIALFISPANLSSGGMTGISIILHALVPKVDQGAWLIILNVPMIALGWKFFGWRFVVSTGYATILSATFMWILNTVFGESCLNILPFLPLTIDLGEKTITNVSAMLISATVGGTLFGVGMGLIFRMGASTAGTDIIVKILRNKFRHVKTGTISMTSDVIIVLCSLFVTNYDMEKLFYTILSVAVFTLVFDLILYGGNSAKTVFIISDSAKGEKISARILKELDTGATLIDATGAYTRKDKIMLMCVVKPYLYPRLRDVVKEEDKNAFMIVSSAKEIYGQGYKNQDDAEI